MRAWIAKQSQGYIIRVQDHVLPVSRSDDLAEALTEWHYTGVHHLTQQGVIDCQFCGYRNIVITFQIVNDTTGAELWTGSRCIQRYSIAGWEQVVTDRGRLNKPLNAMRIDLQKFWKQHPVRELGGVWTWSPYSHGQAVDLQSNEIDEWQLVDANRRLRAKLLLQPIKVQNPPRTIWCWMHYQTLLGGVLKARRGSSVDVDIALLSAERDWRFGGAQLYEAQLRRDTTLDYLKAGSNLPVADRRMLYDKLKALTQDQLVKLANAVLAEVPEDENNVPAFVLTRTLRELQ